METATKTKLPEFKGYPIVPKDIRFPEADFFRGEFGKAVHDEIIAKYGSNNPFVTKDISYNEEDRVVEGSKPGYVVAVNQIIGEEGLRTATPADLEKFLRLEVLDLRGFYEDSALVLRSRDEPNSYLAKNLADQLYLRNKEQKMPVAIPLCGLDLEVDNASPHGLAFKLKDDAEIIYAPILNENSENFSSEDIDEKTGLPKELNGGDRTLYTRQQGLSRLCLDRDLGLYSNYEYLADSNSGGRVVVVSGEATSQKIEGYVNQIKTQEKTQIKEIAERARKAENYIKTGRLE